MSEDVIGPIEWQCREILKDMQRELAENSDFLHPLIFGPDEMIQSLEDHDRERFFESLTVFIQSIREVGVMAGAAKARQGKGESKSVELHERVLHEHLDEYGKTIWKQLYWNLSERLKKEAEKAGLEDFKPLSSKRMKERMAELVSLSPQQRLIEERQRGVKELAKRSEPRRKAVLDRFKSSDSL
jgi:hypothetical protein